MKSSAHNSFPLLYERFTSELLTRIFEMRNPPVPVYILPGADWVFKPAREFSPRRPWPVQQRTTGGNYG